MAVTSDLPNKVRWTWNQFTHVVATEGPRAAMERALGLSGLGVPFLEPEEALVGPPRARLSLAAAARWPVSLTVFGPAEPGRLTRQVLALADELGIPAWTAAPGARDVGSVELASALVVLGLDNWPPPGLLVEAARLRQGIVLLLAADDLDKASLAPAVRRSHCVAVDSDATALALRSRQQPQPVEVRVWGPGARSEELSQILIDLGQRVPR